MVERGLAPSREQARARVERGEVLVGGAPATKPARLVSPGEAIRVLGPPRRYVSRGGDKLEAALARFGVDPAGTRVLDAGSSTGGFTDCLLQHGAASVLAVDVGRGQLDQRIRSDPRVEVRERLDIRSLAGAVPDEPTFDLVTADLSFISLTKVVSVLAGALARPGADLLLLVKPQFEAGRAEVSRGKGVVRDPEIHRRAVSAVCGALEDAGAAIMGVMPSPITGQAGNVEFVVHARAHGAPGSPAERAALVARAVAEAHGPGGGIGGS